MNLITKMLIAGGLLMAFCGCKKNSPSPNDYISYKVDGVYKSLKPEADVVDGDLLIEGGKIGGEDLWIQIDQYPSPGTYNLANSDIADITYSIGIDTYDSIISDTGTVVITSYDGKHVSGTFEFKGDNGNGGIKNITEGQFKAKVTQLGNSTPCSVDPTCYMDTTYGATPMGQLLKHLKLVRAEKLNNNN
jgi:uncharacterized protein DUF6252